MTEQRDYDDTHNDLVRTRGPARAHACVSCGEQALDWAYQHDSPDELVDERGRVYSLDLSRYSPMCRSCHQKFDAPRFTPGVWQKAGKLGGDARTKKLQADPEFAARVREIGRQNHRAETNKTRRRCSSCGLESTPGPMSRHLRASQHNGYEELL